MSPNAPARLPYGHWDNQAGDWARDRFGFARAFGTKAEAEQNLPDEKEAADGDIPRANDAFYREDAGGSRQSDTTQLVGYKLNSLSTPANGTADARHIQSRRVQSRHVQSGSMPDDHDKPVTIYDIYEAAKAAGDPHPKVTAAQWALESLWGKKPSGRFNYFNVKGAGTTLPTTEYVNGRKVHIRAGFKNYGSLQQAIADHTRLLKTKHYAGYGAAKTDQQAVEALVRAGYATNPHYEAELLSIIRKHFPSQPAASAKKPSKRVHKQEITGPLPNMRP